jgi:hypothetical protein
MRLELDYRALERLMGGDEEVQVHLREAIVKQFTRAYLKPIANSALVEAAVQEIKRYVNEVAKSLYDIEGLATSHVWPDLTSRLRSLVEEVVQECAREQLQSILDEAFDCQLKYWRKEIDDKVQKALDQHIERAVEDGIRQRLDVARDLVNRSHS